MEEIEDEFGYVGSRISENGGCPTDIARGHATGKSLVADLPKFWNLNLHNIDK